MGGYYDCGRCGGYTDSCSCYQHRTTNREREARDTVVRACRSVENVFNEWLKGYKYSRDEHGYIDRPAERIPVTELDIGLMMQLKEEWDRLEEVRVKVFKEEYEAGEAKHEADKKVIAEKEAAEEKRVELRERAIERLIEEEVKKGQGIET